MSSAARRAGTVGLWLVIFGLGLYLESVPHYRQRFADMARIEQALANYRANQGIFPRSQGVFSTRKDWIPELVPAYLPKVPQDPRYLKKVPNKQYLYISDGVDYKLIAHAPEDFGFVRKHFPERVDPRRPEHAYGVWTTGAGNW